MLCGGRRTEEEEEEAEEEEEEEKEKEEEKAHLFRASHLAKGEHLVRLSSACFNGQHLESGKASELHIALHCA